MGVMACTNANVLHFYGSF